MELKSFLNGGTKKSSTVVLIKKFHNDGTKSLERFLNKFTKKVP